MKLKTTYISLISLLTLSSCSSDLLDIINPDNWGKTPISLSASAEQTGIISRAGFTSANTRIIAKIKSEKESENATETEWTVASLLASKDNDNNSESYSAVDYKLNESRFWDDTYGREAKVSVYAIAIADKETTLLNNETLLEGVSSANPWIKQTAANNANNLSFNFSVANNQNAVATKCANYDLVYSNNIVKKSDEEDNRLWFGHKDAGKFEKGQLHFNHALTKITVNLVSGEGYISPEDFTSQKTTVLFGNDDFKPYTSGTFDISTGSWSNLKDEALLTMDATDVTENQTKIINNSCLFMPGLSIGTADDHAITITVNGNRYYVSQALLLKALKTSTDMPATDKPATDATSYILKQGMHYIFTINLNKTRVSFVKATLSDWQSVTGSVATTNARISISVSQAEGENACKDVALYRLRDAGNDAITDDYVGKIWNGNYGSAATLTANNEQNKYSTDWFFDDNTCFYHFRTVKQGTAVAYSDTDKDSYFSVSCGTRDNSDPHWGAPINEKGENTYTYKEGFSNIHHAIGATTDDIHIIEQHMLSQINVTLTTTTGNDKVNLEGAKVEFANMYHQGHVLMGNGKVVPVTTGEDAKSNVEMTASTDNTYNYDVVPQDLSSVELIITTKDNNKYNVKLYNIDKISEWKPGHIYNYTFQLTKAGIANVSVSLAPWKEESANGSVWL